MVPLWRCQVLRFQSPRESPHGGKTGSTYNYCKRYKRCSKPEMWLQIYQHVHKLNRQRATSLSAEYSRRNQLSHTIASSGYLVEGTVAHCRSILHVRGLIGNAISPLEQHHYL